MMSLDNLNIFNGIDSVIWFCLGVASVQAWQWIKAKYKDRIDPKGRPHPIKRINWFYASIIITFVVSMAVGVQNQRTYHFATNFSQETRACQEEFFHALQNRSKIAAENDSLSIYQRELVYNWIHDLLFPPAPYSTMEPGDPKRQQWNLTRTLEVDRYYEGSLREQQRLNEERAKNPYPDPKCGNN